MKIQQRTEQIGVLISSEANNSSHPIWFSPPIRSVTDFLQMIIAQLCVLAIKIFADIQVAGKEHVKEIERIKRGGGKFIIASNHSSDLDVLIMRGVLGAIAPEITPLYAVSLEKKHYTEFGIIKKIIYSQFLFKLLGAHPAYIGCNNYKDALPTHEKLLKDGHSVIIFPEGGKTKTGKVGEGKGGVGYLALETGAHVLPVVILGTWNVSPLSFFFRKHKFVISLEKPIPPHELRTYSAHADHRRYKDVGIRIMDGVRERFWDLREGFPSAAQTLSETWHKDTFNGEHDLKHIFLYPTTLIVGYICALLNLIKVSSRKFKNTKVPFRKLLWEMGRDTDHTSFFLLDGLSPWNHGVKITASSWRSLEPFYEYTTKTVLEHNEALARAATLSLSERSRIHFAVLLSRYWMGNSHNRQALLNRLKISTILLSSEIRKIPEGDTVKIISIASGSARGVIQAMKQNLERKFEVTLIDLDPAALDYAKKIAIAAGLDEYFTYVNDTASSIEQITKEYKVHIIEMVGFLDYRDHKQSVKLSKTIHDALRPGGVYLSANIQENHERVLLDWGLLWPMIYKNDKEYYDILRESGFMDRNIQLVHEPFHIHIIGVAKKEQEEQNSP